MLWFHGGAFDEGSNRGPLGLYNGAGIAARGNVCVVGANYRLGVLGALVTDDGTEETRGNQLLKDQRAAMEWVQEEIAHFGGDPAAVTIWGESAGAMSVMLYGALLSLPSNLP
jgi:para-nitrobenzyl esterase